jgi:hypothetical protein
MIDRDFTLNLYKELLENAILDGYQVISVEKYFTHEFDNSKIIILRHDVDRKPINSFLIAQIEKELNIRATYYFRILSCSNNPNIIRKIASLGHEIGYHYEDLALSKGNFNIAIRNFEKNLKYFRQYYPIKTICMHGSPLSKWDNKLLWQKYNFSDYGLIAEPFLNIDYNEFMYISDTGRKWNNNHSNLRDNIVGQNFISNSSTLNLINKLKQADFPAKIHITTHPQRWNNKLAPWLTELLGQNIKNIIKQGIKNFRK